VCIHRTVLVLPEPNVACVGARHVPNAVCGAKACELHRGSVKKMVGTCAFASSSIVESAASVGPGIRLCYMGVAGALLLSALLLVQYSRLVHAELI
jgi:hypothetical protein